MHSTDLTPEHLNQVFAQLAPIAHYLARVKARMIEKNFPPDDELFQMVEKAHTQAQRYLVAEVRQALEKIGTELSMISRDGFKLPPHGKLSGSETCIELMSAHALLTPRADARRSR